MGINSKDIWFKLYADDLVLVIPRESITKVLLSLKMASSQFNLRINAKKSGIFLLNQRFDL